MLGKKEDWRVNDLAKKSFSRKYKLPKCTTIFNIDRNPMQDNLAIPDMLDSVFYIRPQWSGPGGVGPRAPSPVGPGPDGRTLNGCEFANTYHLYALANQKEAKLIQQGHVLSSYDELFEVIHFIIYNFETI